MVVQAWREPAPIGTPQTSNVNLLRDPRGLTFIASRVAPLGGGSDHVRLFVFTSSEGPCLRDNQLCLVEALFAELKNQMGDCVASAYGD
jgi:hypothetical protein